MVRPVWLGLALAMSVGCKTKEVCRQSDECRSEGLCSPQRTKCVAAQDVDCRGSRACAVHGRCEARSGACEPGGEPPRDSPFATKRAHERIEAEWRAYDARETKKKDELLATFDRAMREARSIDGPARKAAEEDCWTSARQRMVPLVQKEAKTKGKHREILVPSDDPAKCRLWGSMWAGDDSTLESLDSIGFKSIECKEKKWDIVQLMRTCFLYDPTKPTGVVFVWKTLDFYKAEKRMGGERGTDAALAYMGLVSRGADTMMPGGTYMITTFGDGWVHINGAGDQKGIVGFVDRQLCHRKPLVE